MTGPLTVTARHAGDGRVVLTLAGELHPVTTPVLRERGAALLRDGHIDLLLDMSAVGFCDSSGLGAVLGLWRQARSAGGDLSLFAVPDRLSRLMRITGIDTLIRVHPHTPDLPAPPATEPV